MNLNVLRFGVCDQFVRQKQSRCNRTYLAGNRMIGPGVQNSSENNCSLWSSTSALLPSCTCIRASTNLNVQSYFLSMFKNCVCCYN
jgi:hypothetical protein